MSSYRQTRFYVVLDTHVYVLICICVNTYICVHKAISPERVWQEKPSNSNEHALHTEFCFLHATGHQEPLSNGKTLF